MKLIQSRSKCEFNVSAIFTESLLLGNFTIFFLSSAISSLQHLVLCLWLVVERAQFHQLNRIYSKLNPYSGPVKLWPLSSNDHDHPVFCLIANLSTVSICNKIGA